MTRKTAEAYLAVFDYIETKLFELQPKEFMTDFEEGMRLAIRIRWPNAVIRGCWFHLCRAIENKTKSLGLTKILKSNSVARMVKKQLMSLALLPADRITVGYASIKLMAREKKLLKKFQSLFAYFESYWLKQVRFLLIELFMFTD